MFARIQGTERGDVFNTFTAIVDLSRFNNSCLKSLSETAHSPSKHKDKHGFIISQCKHTEL